MEVSYKMDWYKTKVVLETQQDALDFLEIIRNEPGEIKLVGTDGSMECTVNARSMLGVLYSIEWEDLWCYSDHDIYTKLGKFAR